MMRFFSAAPQACACVWLLALSAGAWAEQPDPLDAEAKIPTLDYHSPLATYRRFETAPRQDWRAANDQVGRIGGWRTYAQEPWVQPEADDGAGTPHDHHDH